MSDMALVVDRLAEITKIQAEVIDDLFLLLMQHVTAEEAERLPALGKAAHAAEIRREIGL